MKKILSVLLLGIMLIFAGCGNANTEPAEDPSSDTVQEEQVNAEEYSELLPLTYKVPGREIYVSVPNLQEVNYGFVQTYLVKKNRIFAVTCDQNHPCTDLEEAHGVCMDTFMACIQDAVFANSLQIEKESLAAINGIEFYQYEGSMNCGHSMPYEAFTIGCSFVMDGYPCSIIGMASHDDQSEELVQEVRETMEAMIRTVRAAE